MPVFIENPTVNFSTGECRALVIVYCVSGQLKAKFNAIGKWNNGNFIGEVYREDTQDELSGPLLENLNRTWDTVYRASQSTKK